MNEKEWKEWFEQNFLDGDPIQKGQMLSSEECLEAVMETQRLERERIRRIIESEFNAIVFDRMGIASSTHDFKDLILSKLTNE